MSSDEGGGNGSGFFAGFLLGAIAGGAVAMLLAQEETRDLLVGKAREAGNLAMDASGDLRGRYADLYERGRTIVENSRATMGDASEQ
ncbi:MAG TPA: YtxH domain-containing protein [Candidatus Acidoferrales bacterium]|nr:YtxH domain-containing protein [Candidatus Acidoferrales bacterium]